MQDHAVDDGWDARPLGSSRYLANPIVESCSSFGNPAILEIGCGNGTLTEILAGRGFSVVGFDSDPRGVELAQVRAGSARLFRHDVYDGPGVFGDERFDVVVASEVVEHLLLPGRLIAFAGQVLRPGGHLIVTTPYHGYWKNLILALLGRWDRHHQPLREGGHVKFWSRSTLTTLIGPAASTWSSSGEWAASPVSGRV